MSDRKNALPWLGLSVAIIVLDWISKQWALSALTYAVSQEVVPGFWNWTLVHNTGAAFSFLADAGGWQQWLFSALAVIISAVCVVMLAKQPRSDWRMALPLALIVGGALGNLAISVAAVLLIVFSFVPDRTPESP